MDEKDLEKKKPRLRKPPITQREKAEQARLDQEKAESKPKLKAKAKHQAGRAGGFLKNEYYLPMPKNRFGSFLNKRRRLMPKYFRDSWAEIKLVTWPGRKETWRLTLAVFIFAIIFSTLVGILDKGLDILFKDIILE